MGSLLNFSHYGNNFYMIFHFISVYFFYYIYIYIYIEIIVKKFFFREGEGLIAFNVCLKGGRARTLTVVPCSNLLAGELPLPEKGGKLAF